MPPKTRVTKEEILLSALELVREKGAEGLNARALAEWMGVSTQPIFSNFASMDQLRQAVIAAAWEEEQRFTHKELESGRWPAYKATGMAYIRFAREEKELFRLLFMRSRQDEPRKEQFGPEIGLLQEATGLSRDEAMRLHLEMWVFVHGVAGLLVTDYQDLDEELISSMVTDVYMGLRARYGKEEPK